MTRFPGVTAVPVISGMSPSCEGVCGLFCPAASDMRCREGVAVEARNELRWASACAWRRLAFSCRSSLRGTLGCVSSIASKKDVAYFMGVFCGEAAMLYLVVRAMVGDRVMRYRRRRVAMFVNTLRAVRVQGTAAARGSGSCLPALATAVAH